VIKVPAIAWYLLCAALGVLPGCGIFSNNRTDYKEANVLPPLVIPEGIDAPLLESPYAIPEVATNDFEFIEEDKKLVIPRPSRMSQDSEFARVKIQKVGDRRWVLAEAPTSQVWPLVQSFLARNGILVAQARPQVGEIETGWLKFKVDGSTKSRYKIRIEKGVREESSEIHVLHQQAPLAASSPEALHPDSMAEEVSGDEWPLASSDLEREAWLLDELSISVAEGVSNRAASLLGQSVGGDDKIILRRDGAEPVLDFRLDKERTHATLIYALNKEGLRVWEDNVDLGLFYFAYDDPSNEPGWWDRITFQGSDDVPAVPPVALSQVLANLAPDAEAVFGDLPGAMIPTEPLAKPQPTGYLLRVKENNGKMTAYVRNTSGQQLPFSEARKLMVVIRRNLI
jgi:outer membrane protein assembly factor BamC